MSGTETYRCRKSIRGEKTPSARQTKFLSITKIALSPHEEIISSKTADFLQGLFQSGQSRGEEHMIVGLTGKFYTKIGGLLIMLVLNSSANVRRMNYCRSINEGDCVVLCKHWDLGSESLKEILESEGKSFEACTLVLENCSQANTTWNGINGINGLPKIVDLKIIDSLVDLNELNLEIFKNLRRLTLKNTATVSLRAEVFHQVPNLQKLEIKMYNCIKWVEEGFLQDLALHSLQIQGLGLNQSQTAQFFKNLTGGHDIPGIEQLDWSHNNFGNFTADLLTHFPNLHHLTLTNSSIFAFDEGTFDRSSIKNITINQNKIQHLPEKTFRPLLENAFFVSLTDNNLTCDCDIKWLQTLLKQRQRTVFQITCAYPEVSDFLNTKICPENKPEESSTVHCTPKNSETEIGFFLTRSTPQKFSITNDKPDIIEITVPKIIDNSFLIYGNYANSTFPQFSCLKMQEKFRIPVTPETNYLICLGTISQQYQIDIFDCHPFKTRPPYEDEPLLTRKSMPLSILLILVVFIFALAFGALILYLSIRKNPSLIRGSKRVIEVKRHDKAQVLIMPRGYESVSQTDGSLMLTNPRLSLERSRSSLNCDSISTVSYVSANQPTQLEILSYRLNRIRELFQRNNNIPRPMPMQIATPINQRLPPDVDLLFEYEWYTITTTTTE